MTAVLLDVQQHTTISNVVAHLWWVMQEVGSYRPAVRPERRRAMQQEIVASAPHALQVLASCLNHKGEQQSSHSLPRVLIRLNRHNR